MVVVDGALSAKIVSEAGAEVLDMDNAGQLSCSEQQPCNPGILISLYFSPALLPSTFTFGTHH